MRLAQIYANMSLYKKSEYCVALLKGQLALNLIRIAQSVYIIAKF